MYMSLCFQHVVIMGGRGPFPCMDGIGMLLAPSSPKGTHYCQNRYCSIVGPTDWEVGQQLHVSPICFWQQSCNSLGYLHSVDWSAGLECWNGVLEWNHWNGVKHWSGPVTTYKWIKLH